MTVTLLAALGGVAPDGAPPPALVTARVSAAVDDPRPNIVLITTDDQTVADLRWMPNTRRLLAARGVDFRNSLSPHPLCCPARAEILTGQLAQNNGVRTNRGPMGGFHQLETDHTIATWLQEAGYQTAFVGKFLNGYSARDGILPGWDIFNPTVQGVYRYYGYTMLNNGRPLRYPNTHNADLMGIKTADYISRFAGSRPFFIWQSQTAPHGTCDPAQELTCWVGPVPARRHAKLFNSAQPPSLNDPAFNEADVSDKPASIRGRPRKEVAHIRDTFRKRIRSLQSVDEAVARTVAALVRTGELDNTLIVFTSDNGYLLGEHRFEGKDVPYEQALRVPLLVRGPGAPAGVLRNQTVTTVDLAPTLLAAASAAADITMDGRSLMPFLGQGGAGGYGTVLIQSGPQGPRQLDHGWNYRGVRTARYTYARYTVGGFPELYDRVRDPHQLVNVARERRYAEIREELARRATLLGDCSGATCRSRFGPLPQPRAARSSKSR